MTGAGDVPTAPTTADDCSFCKIVRGDAPCHEVWQDERHLAFRSIYPNTTGFSVVTTKRHDPSDAFALDDDVLAGLVLAAGRVGRLLGRAFQDVGRTGHIAIGFADFPLIAFHFQQASVVRPAVVAACYALAMAVDGAAVLVLGRLIDRTGIRVLAGVAVVSSTLAPLVFLGSAPLALIGVVVWGIGLGAQESVFHAAVAPIVSAQRQASAYGLFDAGFGIAWFAGSALMGVLYDHSLVALVVVSAVQCFCPGCWGAIDCEAETCTHCGYRIEEYRRLDYEAKLFDLSLSGRLTARLKAYRQAHGLTAGSAARSLHLDPDGSGFRGYFIVAVPCEDAAFVVPDGAFSVDDLGECPLEQWHQLQIAEHTEALGRLETPEQLEAFYRAMHGQQQFRHFGAWYGKRTVDAETGEVVAPKSAGGAGSSRHPWAPGQVICPLHPGRR